MVDGQENGNGEAPSDQQPALLRMVIEYDPATQRPSVKANFTDLPVMYSMLEMARDSLFVNGVLKPLLEERKIIPATMGVDGIRPLRRI